MAARDLKEDWSSEDLDLLLRLAWDHLDESMRCHKAGASHAALVMLGGALEAVLLGAVVAYQYQDKVSEYEDTLCKAKAPRRPPSALHLSDLAKVARELGWLDQRLAGEQVINAFNGLRTAAAHPGAYVRGKRNNRDSDPEFDLRDPGWYETAYEIMFRVCKELFSQLGSHADDDSSTNTTTS